MFTCGTCRYILSRMRILPTTHAFERLTYAHLTMAHFFPPLQDIYENDYRFLVAKENIFFTLLGDPPEGSFKQKVLDTRIDSDQVRLNLDKQKYIW